MQLWEQGKVDLDRPVNDFVRGSFRVILPSVGFGKMMSCLSEEISFTPAEVYISVTKESDTSLVKQSFAAVTEICTVPVNPEAQKISALVPVLVVVPASEGVRVQAYEVALADSLHVYTVEVGK